MALNSGSPSHDSYALTMTASGQTLIFDGDCGFCTSAVRQLRRWVKPRATIIEWQRAGLDALGVTAEECNDAVQWVAPGGRHVSGGAAVAAVLKAGRSPWPAVGRGLSAPFIAQLTEKTYQLVARNRYRLPGSTPACALPPASS